MLAVNRLSPPLYAQRRSTSAKKSFSTLSWPISWYNRATRVSSAFFFLAWSSPKILAASSLRAFFHLVTRVGCTSYLMEIWAIVSSPFKDSSATFALNEGLCFLLLSFISCSFLFFYFRGQDSTLTSCPNFGDHLKLLYEAKRYRLRVLMVGQTSR